jgi:hypothetical protein
VRDIDVPPFTVKSRVDLKERLSGVFKISPIEDQHK